MRKVILLALILLIAAFALWYFGGPQGPSLKDVAGLRTPRMIERAPQKVILVELTGDPSITVRTGFGLLYKTYYKLPGVSKGSHMPAPLARWPMPFETPRREWVGRYAMPIPDQITTLPQISGPGGIKPLLATWSGGKAAEILHVGSYATEGSTVAKLHKFIADSGYEISGEHEEEYLRSSGMLFAGNPDTYLTVIRYPVRKK